MRLDGTPARATVAKKVMREGKTAEQAGARHARRPHTSESAQRRRREGVDPAQPVRRYQRGAKRSAAGMGCTADPLEASVARRFGATGRAEGVRRVKRGNDGSPKVRDAKGGSMRKHESAAGHHARGRRRPGNRLPL